MRTLLVWVGLLGFLTACSTTSKVKSGTTPYTTSAAWTGTIPCAATPTFWPFGAAGAVSLTYDDAMTSPVRHALPALDAQGFKATFFLTTGKRWNASVWKPLVHSGHELASHSVTHNSNITQAAMAQEVADSLNTIKALGVVQPHFSFAYPNGQPNGTDGSYAPGVLQHTLAARGLNGASQKLGVPVDYGNLPSRVLAETDNLPAIINETLAQHSWTVFVIHGIEDDLYLNIPKTKHDELVALLASQGKNVWVAPFITVADYLQRCQK